MADITVHSLQLSPSELATFVPAITIGDVPWYWVPRPNPLTFCSAAATTNGLNVDPGGRVTASPA